MDDEFKKFLAEAGTTNIRQLPNGLWAGIHPFLFTYGLMVGLKHDPFDFFKTRFCYETKAEAATALEQWDGKGLPPGNWIKQKPEDISNPKRV